MQFSKEQRDLLYNCPAVKTPTPDEKGQHVIEAFKLEFNFSCNDGEGDLYKHHMTNTDLYFFERRSLWCLRRKTDDKRLGVGASPLLAVQNYRESLEVALDEVTQSILSLPRLSVNR